MKSFGTHEYGNNDGFKTICQNCGKEARIVPVHEYRNGDFVNPEKITLEIRCTCGNRFGAEIYHK